MKPPVSRGNRREAHAHIAQHGRAMSMLDLSACPSREDAIDALARRAAAMSADPPSAWLLAHSARPESWPDPRWPSLAELDAAVPDRPALAWCFDYHALVVNSHAARAGAIAADTPDPPAGIIERGDDGRPTGLLLEAAATLAWDRVPEPTPDERRAHVRAALDDLARLGFDEVHDLKSQTWLGPLLGELDDDGQLPCRVLLYPLAQDLAEVHAGRAAWERDGVRLAGSKIFTDGTLNSRTAWMLSPYADPIPGRPNGAPTMTPDQIEAAVRASDELGLPVAAHAIGDGAVRAVLDAIERVRPRARGQRIEHAELIEEADVPRFARLGVVASVQPCHLLADIEALTRLLPDRLGRVLPLRELIDSGCAPGGLLWFGSDTPIVRPDPNDSILAATRRRRDGEDANAAIAPEQAITPEEAWACFESR